MVAVWGLTSPLTSCGRIGFDLDGESNAAAGAGPGGGVAQGAGGVVTAAGSAGGVGPASAGGSGGSEQALPGDAASSAGAGGSDVPDAASEAGAGGTSAPDAGAGGAASGGASSGGAASGGAGAGGAASIDSVISAGTFHTCGLTSGTLECWGGNQTSALGGVGGASSPSPTPVLGAAVGATFTSVVASQASGLAIRSDGAVLAWGANAKGQLGLGDRNVRPTPVVVPLPAAAVSITGGYELSCAVLTDGRGYCWGNNQEGQMGQSDAFNAPDALSPTQVPGTSTWLALASGEGHVCGIQAPGTLWCWGRNGYAELGLGAITPGQIRSPQRVGTASDWRRVATGTFHSCGIRGAGALYCWGRNDSFQLGLGNDPATRLAPSQVGTATDWARVSTNAFHTCGLRRPGILWCWGRNVEGQLATSDNTDRDVPTYMSDDTTWVEIDTGRFHTCAARSNASVWCTGENADGQLGLGNTNRRNVWTPVP